MIVRLCLCKGPNITSDRTQLKWPQLLLRERLGPRGPQDGSAAVRGSVSVQNPDNLHECCFPLIILPHPFQSRSLCSSPLPEPIPSLTSSSSSSPSEWGPQAREGEWGGQNRAASPARVGQASPQPYQHQDHQQRPCMCFYKAEKCPIHLYSSDALRLHLHR